MKYNILICLFFLVGCSANTKSAPVEIENLKVGLICPHQQSLEHTNQRFGEICLETDEIFISGQGECQYGDQIHPCTWYGFEFDYKNAKTSIITCIVKNSKAANFVNVDGLAKSDANTFEWEIELVDDSGHFYNPQYSLFKTAEIGQDIQYSETRCFADDQELFQFKSKEIYPIQKIKVP